MNTISEEIRRYYVVLWNFESEVSGDVMADGVVFSDAEAAKKEAVEKFCGVLNYDFAPRVRPIFSRRLGTSGFVVGEVVVKAISAGHPAMALRDAVEGKGEELDWAK